MSVESLGMPDPNQHTQENGADAEVFHTPKADAELIVGRFIEELHQGREVSLHGEELAFRISQELVVPEDPRQRSELAKISFAADAFSDPEVLSHKRAEDRVFNDLFQKLIDTRDDKNLSQAQRVVLRELLDIRAAIVSPRTRHDPMWQDLIDRLLT